MKCLPNYKDGSIVNLMSSIGRSFGLRTNYNPLNILSPSKISDSKNLVLIVIDGLGYDYLIQKNKSLLHKHIVGPMTSVFPPTTASAVTTFLTGLPPQQHAITGWFMNLKELGVVSKILQFSPRYSDMPFSLDGFDVISILSTEPFSAKIKVKNFVIQPKDIIFSDYSKAMSKKAGLLPYSTLNGFFYQIRKAVKSTNRKKYVYAYWSEFDGLNHNHGVNHAKSDKHFKEIDNKFGKLINSLKGSDTTIIVTADHGFVNAPFERLIWLKDHPKLQECLTLPLCGEGRAAYCYIHPAKAKQFESYIKKNLKKYCNLFKSQDLIKKNYFGLFTPNPNLFDRVGDYILIFKENYLIKDKIKKGKKKLHVGHHGGVSRQEMLVPLVVVRC